MILIFFIINIYACSRQHVCLYAGVFFSGAGQEVGRSCIMLEFKGKKIMVCKTVNNASDEVTSKFFPIDTSQFQFYRENLYSNSLIQTLRIESNSNAINFKTALLQLENNYVYHNHSSVVIKQHSSVYVCLSLDPLSVNFEFGASKCLNGRDCLCKMVFISINFACMQQKWYL